MPEYTDVEIQIRKDEMRVRIKDDTYRGVPALDDELLNRLTDLRVEGPDSYGRELFRAVFAQENPIKEAYQVARARARNREGRFRLRLNLDLNCPELHRLCWEALHDPDPPPHRLAAWRGTPLSRMLDGVGSPPAKASRLRVLGVVASPQDLGQGTWSRLKPIDAALEHQTLEAAFADLDDRVEYVPMEPPVTYHRIWEKLDREHFHVLHLVCHGAFVDDEDPTGVVVLENEERRVQFATDVEMADLVKELEDLQLVVLAACQTAQRSNLDAFLGVAPRMIEYGLSAVVAMQDEVEQESARLFTRAFYDSLARSSETGGLVDVAVNDARQQLFFKHRIDRPTTWEWVTPVVFLRGDGQVFEPLEEDGAAEAAPHGSTEIATASITPFPRAARFARPSPELPSIDPVDPDWQLEILHLLVYKHAFNVQELKILAWRLGIKLPANLNDEMEMAQAVIDETARAGKVARLPEAVLAVLSFRNKGINDLLSVAG